MQVVEKGTSGLSQSQSVLMKFVDEESSGPYQLVNEGSSGHSQSVDEESSGPYQLVNEGSSSHSQSVEEGSSGPYQS